MAIITISGKLASGAIEVGQLVAQKLGFDYVDKQTLMEAARALGVADRAMLDRDDTAPPPPLRERLIAFFEDFLERSAVAGAADPLMGTANMEALMATTYREAAALPEAGHEFSDARYKEVITSVMKEVADRGNVVIIGRGSQAILKDYADSLHVCITAPRAVRTHRLAVSDGLPEEKAKEHVEDSDKGRADFHHKYFKVDPDNSDLYDLIVNTAGLSEEKVAELIATTLRLKLSRAASPA
jgi:cytidylate kinase